MADQQDLGRLYTGFITRHGILHLYKEPADLCKDLEAWRKDRDFSMIAWLEKTIIHEKGSCASENT